VTEEILISVTAAETRVAVVVDGTLQDIYIERSGLRGLTNNIYLGKVVRILPGMQSAFVDIGEQKAGFIHISDIFPVAADGMELAGGAEDISQCLRDGQSLLVQVSKEPLGDKGARLTTRISLSSRYLVYLPRSSHIGISRQIKSNNERSRLRGQLDMAAHCLGLADCGYILRTAAQGASAAGLQAELEVLHKHWQAVDEQIKGSALPARLYQAPPLIARTIRDLVHPGLDRIRVDKAVVQQGLFDEESLSDLPVVLECYEASQPLFDLYAVDEQIEQALARRVNLKSGAYLVIDQTEAMTTIDVNSGSFVGDGDPAQTILSTNLEAVAAVADQLRLRNLGGIVIIDFIDMSDDEHRRQLINDLEEALSSDTVPTVISGVSALGLVELTRKRSGESLAQLLCESCPACDGRGTVKSIETICYEIFRKILGDADSCETDTLKVLAAEEIVCRLLGVDAGSVADLEVSVGKTIQFGVRPDYSRDQFIIMRV
jgi:ribonuclease G